MSGPEPILRCGSNARSRGADGIGGGVGGAIGEFRVVGILGRVDMLVT